MIIAFAILASAFLGLFVAALIKGERLQKQVALRGQEVIAAKQEAEQACQKFTAEALRIQNAAQAALAEAQKLVDQQIAETNQEAERVRQHYEAAALQIQSAANELLSKTIKELEPLKKFEGIRDAEIEGRNLLATALREATGLQAEAKTLLEKSRSALDDERTHAIQRAREIRQHAEVLLDQATRDAGRIVDEAEKRAVKIGGDAYVALREKNLLEEAVRAMRNVVESYGDRYVIPTRSLLNDLAADFGHTEGGQALASARDHSRRMVEQGQAADCGFAEANRKDAIRFVILAFDGRVDAILSRTKHDNYGTLEQEIRDTFNLVNLNGKAFRDTRILPAYLDARLAELRWAVVVHELRLKEREEQRRIKEQMRQEEKARREYERTIKEAEDQQEADRRALEKARLEVEQANAGQRAKLEEQIAMLNQRLAEAEANKQRAISMAQQTRAGVVYIISNVGSFGEEVFKIGMTRRQDPMDRVWELGDASVPFDFDVHAMLRADDAPGLERLLHSEFDDLRINKVNFRKEFFRLSLEKLRNFVVANGIEASFTMVAEAHEYRETQALNTMTPKEREKYHLRRDGDNDIDAE